MLNRRQFTADLSIGLASLTGLTTMPGLFAAEPKPQRASKYIDVHTHIGKYVDPTKTLTVDGLLSWMDEHDVEQAVVLPLTSWWHTTYDRLAAMQRNFEDSADWAPFPQPDDDTRSGQDIGRREQDLLD